MILVPTDFTAVADTALQHALVIAKTVSVEVTLMHVVKKEKEVAEAEQKVAEQAKKVGDGHAVNIHHMVRVGNIFDDIGGVAEEIEASLILMGTHGAKGMQKLTGSYALKVITNSAAPFIVVQKKEAPADGYQKIVFPLDLTKESVQPLKMATDLAKYFDSEIFLIGEQQGDPYLDNKVKANMVFAKKRFASEGIRANVTISEGNGSFDDEVVKYAKSLDADLICVVNYQETFIHLFGNFEQNIIANPEEIPALIINPKTLTKSGSVMFT